MKNLLTSLSMILLLSCTENKVSSPDILDNDEAVLGTKVSQILEPAIYQKDLKTTFELHLFNNESNINQVLSDALESYEENIEFSHSEEAVIDNTYIKTSFYDCILGGILIKETYNDGARDVTRQYTNDCVTKDGLIVMDFTVGDDLFLKGSMTTSNETDEVTIKANTVASLVEIYIENTSESFLVRFNKNDLYAIYYGTNQMKLTGFQNQPFIDSKCEYSDEFFIEIDGQSRFFHADNYRDSCLDNPTLEFEHTINPKTQLVYKINDIPNSNVTLSKLSFDGNRAIFFGGDWPFIDVSTSSRSYNFGTYGVAESETYFTFINPSNVPVTEYIQIEETENLTFDLYEATTLNELFRFEGNWTGNEPREFEHIYAPWWPFELDQSDITEVFINYPNFTFEITETKNISIFIESNVDNALIVSDINNNRINYFWSYDEYENSQFHFKYAEYTDDFSKFNAHYLFEGLKPGIYKVFAKTTYAGDNDSFVITIDEF